MSVYKIISPRVIKIFLKLHKDTRDNFYIQFIYFHGRASDVSFVTRQQI